MARRKARKARARFFAKKTYRSNKSGMSGLIPTVIGAGVYGALREKLSVYMQPLTANIPLGNIADEVALGASAVLLKKFVGKKVPMLNPVLNGAIVIESARIGEAMAKGQLGIGSNSNSTSGNMLG